jgi:hypothetical protein
MLFLGCSRTPGARLGEQALQAVVNQQSGGRIAVTDFKKENGIEREIAGQRMYTMEYAATIRFAKGGWKGGNAFEGYFSSFAAADRAPGGGDGFGKNWKYFEKNAELQLSGEITFENTENGWRSTDCGVQTVKIVSNRPDAEYYDQFIGVWVNEGGWPMKIVKEGTQYRLLNNYNDTFTILDPESQALKYQELGVPEYIHFDPEKRQVRSSGNSFSKVDDESAYDRLRAVAISPPAGAVSQEVASQPAPHGAGIFKLRAVIDDPDGYTNVRSGKSGSSSVVAIVRSGEEFVTFQQAGDWWQVRTSSGVVGYMHATRIKIAG